LSRASNLHGGGVECGNAQTCMLMYTGQEHASLSLSEAWWCLSDISFDHYLKSQMCRYKDLKVVGVACMSIYMVFSV